MRYLTPLAMLTTALMVLSCSPLQQQQQQHPRKEQSEANKTPAPMYLGDVQQVYPAHGFALLRIIGPIPPAGVTLITHPADGSTDRMGNLVVSADASPRQGMVAADIRAGTVVSGDLVFQYRNIAPPEAEEGEKPIRISPTTPTGTSSTTPVQVHATRNDLPTKPATPAATPTQPTRPDPAPATPTQQATQPTSPTLPTGPINLPDMPDKAPNYLNDIPNDINQWN